MVVGLYAGILALMQLWLTWRVIKERRANKITLGDKGNPDLLCAIRTHGNFIETVPGLLTLLLILELGGVLTPILHMFGGALVIARILHFMGLNKEGHVGQGRVMGMKMIFLLYLVGGVLCILLGLPFDFGLTQ